MNRPPGGEDSGWREKEEEEDEEIKNHQLKTVLDFYDCYDLLPYVSHIMWLSAVKEALGHIPFSLDYRTIRMLVILQDEIGKKTAYESLKMKQDADRSRSASLSRVR